MLSKYVLTLSLSGTEFSMTLMIHSVVKKSLVISLLSYIIKSIFICSYKMLENLWQVFPPQRLNYCVMLINPRESLSKNIF